MPIILIKNNLKLMLRSKWILCLMILGPLLTIGMLSSAFHNMMNTKYQIDNLQTGYRITKDSPYQEMMPKLKAICKENNIILKEYPDEQGKSIKKLIGNQTVSVFVDIKKNSYVIYKASDKKTEAAVIESIFTSFFHQVKDAMLLGSLNIPFQSNGNDTVHVEKLKTDPIPSSIDYYGIIYIVYFAWCGMVSLLAVIASERKGATPRRMQAAHLSKWNYYMGKFVPCTIAVFLESCAGWALSAVCYGVHWGRIEISTIIMLLVSMGTAAFGIFLFQLFSNVAISIVAAFVVIWIAGFFGGSFQPYMYSDMPQRLINASPIYHIDRTLVEFSTKGYSDYTDRCILFLVAIIVVFSIFSIMLINKKNEEV